MTFDPWVEPQRPFFELKTPQLFSRIKRPVWRHFAASWMLWRSMWMCCSSRWERLEFLGEDQVSSAARGDFFFFFFKHLMRAQTLWGLFPGYLFTACTHFPLQMVWAPLGFISVYFLLLFLLCCWGDKCWWVGGGFQRFCSCRCVSVFQILEEEFS